MPYRLATPLYREYYSRRDLFQRPCFPYPLVSAGIPTSRFSDVPYPSFQREALTPRFGGAPSPVTWD